MKKLFLIVGISLALVSCSKTLFQSNSKAKNVYMLAEKQVPDNNYYLDPVMSISRVEPVGDSVRLYTHIIDGDNTFLSGAASAVNRRNWCTLNVNNAAVTNYNVREVYEDQSIPTVYALVLDHSGSMSTKVTSMQNAVRAFIIKKHPQDAICIVKYDSHTKLEVPINTNASLLLSQFPPNALDGYGGTTAILNGIMTGMETIKPAAYRRKVVISFTDGADNASTISKEYVTWYAQQNNINLCTIDFNNSPYNDFMPELANNTGGTYTYFNNTNDFNNVFDDVVNKMGHAYVVSYKKQQPGQQVVMLRYCAEPTALEANATFTTDRNATEPVRNTQPPATTQTASSADRPVYYRPTNTYNSNGITTTPAYNNNNATRPTVAPPRQGSGASGTTSPTNPGAVNPGAGTSTSKPTTSPATGSGSVPAKPGSGHPTTNTPVNPGVGGVSGNGSSGNSGQGKPDVSPVTKPTSPAPTNSKPGTTVKPVKGDTTKPSGTTPTSNSGSNPSKPVTSSPSTTTPTNRGTSSSDKKPTGKLGQTRGPN